jgi:hypothetical protein
MELLQHHRRPSYPAEHTQYISFWSSGSDADEPDERPVQVHGAVREQELKGGLRELPGPAQNAVVSGGGSSYESTRVWGERYFKEDGDPKGKTDPPGRLLPE